MFAITNASKIAARRTFATAAHKAPINPLIPKQYQYSFQKSWLSDSSTYPIMAIMACASSFAVGMTLYASTNYNGVKVRSETKNSIMPVTNSAATPGNQLTERATRSPVSFLGHGDRIKSLRQEGLGVNHEEWLKAKAASRSS